MQLNARKTILVYDICKHISKKSIYPTSNSNSNSNSNRIIRIMTSVVVVVVVVVIVDLNY